LSYAGFSDFAPFATGLHGFLEVWCPGSACWGSAMPEPGGRDQDRDLLDRARAAAIAGERERAITLYRDVLAARPADALPHRQLGRLLQEAGAADEAVAGYRHAIALAPGDAPAHEALGRLLLSRGDLAGARAHLAAAVLHDAQRATAQTALGDLLRRE